MIFRQLIDQASSTYTYLLADEKTKKAVLIDTVFEQHARDTALLRELGLELTHTLDTHVHADHVTGAWLMKKALGSRIVISEAAGVPCADTAVKDGDQISFGDPALRVRTTPGHTDGCVTYVLDDESMAFTGDTLLIRGAGRTDFQQGDPERMFRSIREQIFTLPEHCLLYPAHDYLGRTVTTVAEEKAYNPRVGGDASQEDFVGYMRNLGLPHPKQIEIAVPANMRCGEPESGELPLVAAWGPVVQTYAGLPEIDPAWVADHRNNVHILDVRTTQEWNGELGHIPEAHLIPIDELASRVREVPRDRPVLTICRSGKRSAQAAVLLQKAGLPDVANIAGGMLRWRALGLPAKS